MSDEEPWYVTAFRGDYRELYAHRDLGAAREEVGQLLDLGLRGPVLDLCCGFGRHTLALLERGVDVFGVDLSPDLLRGADPVLSGHLVRSDARALPFAEASFEGLVNLFSSFGYFGEEGDLQVLDEISRVLRPGGAAFMDLMNPDYIRATLIPRSERETEGVRLTETRSLADGGRRVVKNVRMILPSGEERRWREDVRMYTAANLADALAARGLVLQAVSGGFDGRPVTAETSRQLLSLRRE